AEDGIRDDLVTGVQTCALPISGSGRKNCSVAVAADGGTTGMRGKGPLLRELLDARDVVAGEADKDGLGRRLAIDPILNIVAFGEIGRASCKERVYMSVAGRPGG